MSRQWIWVQSNTPPKCKLAKWEKQARLAKVEEFLRTYYRPQFVKPPPANPEFNYIVDFSAGWHGSYLRLSVKYACPSPRALAPSFERAFARMGYFGGSDRYNLWARRHNDQWIVMARNLTLEACFAQMRQNPWFEF
jgi:hypothetical protein